MATRWEDLIEVGTDRAAVLVALRAKTQTAPVALLELASLVRILKEVAPCGYAT
jgi:hypothetical protein